MGQNKKPFDAWNALDIALLVIGWKLFGLGGGIGAAIISFGLRKTITNSLYSKGKKTLYSALYVLGGLIIAFGFAIGITMLIDRNQNNGAGTEPNPIVISNVVKKKTGLGEIFVPTKETVFNISFTADNPIFVCVMDEANLNIWQKEGDFNCLNLEQIKQDKFSTSTAFSQILKAGKYSFTIFGNDDSDSKFVLTVGHN
ncbi:MAG: hypothetical protein JWO73_160 [Candidatus Taylorbacteria bacterium]|nr:hypothetical protein [Candidatus Taylorbacteria bacterium]